MAMALGQGTDISVHAAHASRFIYDHVIVAVPPLSFPPITDPFDLPQPRHLRPLQLRLKPYGQDAMFISKCQSWISVI
jgi:hypothetical protein